MQAIQQAIREIYGGDPIKGQAALSQLIAYEDEGEAFFLEGILRDPPTILAYRRLLQYVAARERTILPKLIGKIDEVEFTHENYTVAKLLAGAFDSSFCISILMDRFKYPLTTYSENAGALLKAWGYAGGGGWACIDSVEDTRLWEKCGVDALRGISATVARLNEGDLVHLEHIVANEWDSFRWAPMPSTKAGTGRRTIIKSQDYWFEGYYTFPLWRRGAVCDAILARWLHHDHYRIRQFGLHILGGLGFQRVVSPVISRFYIEPDEEIKASLLGVLSRCHTVEAANFLLDTLEENPSAGAAFVKLSHLASNREGAVAALTRLLSPSPAGELAEGLIALGKMGVMPEMINQYLDSPNYYVRLNAALCVGYLDEKAFIPRLQSLLVESSQVMERVFVAVALCMLQGGGAARHLHSELVKASSDPDYDRRIDFIYLHKHFQQAILDAFVACKTDGMEYHEAWNQQFSSIDPVQDKTILTPVAAGPKVPATPPTTAAVEIFFSYAWGEKREKIVDALYETLKSEGRYQVVRDKHDLGYRQLILDFMQRLGEGRFVITAFSDKYLRSQFCMFELYELYRHSQSDIRLLLEKIYPILVEPLDLNNASVIGGYLRYWEQLEKEWADLVNKNTHQISAAHFQQYQRIKKISQHISELLELIANVNSLSVQMLAADNFLLIKQEIEKNITQPSQ